MSVHTFGNTTAPSAGANDSSSSEQAPNVSTTITGSYYITTLHAYFGATSGSITAHLLLINSNANGRALLADAGAMTVGGQTWQSQTLPTPFFITNTSDIEVGFWHTGQAHFSVYGSGTWQQGNPGSPSGTSGFSTPGSPFFQGGLGYYIEAVDPLAVSGVSPSNAAAGTNVTISGAGFVGGNITSIVFGSTAAGGWTVNNDGSITVAVPAGTSGGSMTLAVNSDHGNGSTSFYVNEPPTISGISPTAGAVSSSVTITGTFFDAVTSVQFNSGVASSFTVNSSTQITATVPAGAITGAITVTTSYGSATSATFTVYAAHAYDGSAWQTATPYAYDGAAFQPCQVFIYDGSAWQQAL